MFMFSPSSGEGKRGAEQRAAGNVGLGGKAVGGLKYCHLLLLPHFTHTKDAEYNVS